jgi:hypothetical protein
MFYIVVNIASLSRAGKRSPTGFFCLSQEAKRDASPTNAKRRTVNAEGLFCVETER